MSKDYLKSKDLYQIATLADPRFSPDGRWLAYVHTQPDQGSNEYKSAIWLVPVGGGPSRQFTNGVKRDSAPRWSPDGRWLAFVSTRGGEKAKPQIYLIPTDGGEARQLTKMEKGAGEPAIADRSTQRGIRLAGRHGSQCDARVVREVWVGQQLRQGRHGSVGADHL